jgi:CheY-like chemotaxis protein
MLERVLLVDDVALNREIYRSLLEGTVRHFDEAADGAEACALFQRHAYEAVLMDVQMPGMEGDEAVARMRAWEAAHGRSPTPILAVSAGDGAEDEARLLAAGATAFLGKPLKREVLMSLLRRQPSPNPAEHALARLLPKLFVVADAMLDELAASVDPQAVAKLLHQLRGLLVVYNFTSLDEGLKQAYLAAQQGTLPDAALYARWREELQRLETAAVS